MRDFVYTSMPSRVVFGCGKVAALAGEIEALGAKRVLLCCTPGRRTEAERVAERLGALAAGIAPFAQLYVSGEAASEGVRMARETGADGLVSYGGGTAIGLAKAIALELDLPLISVVTTYSGSEMTALQGMLEDGRKVLRRSPRMLPRTVIYDPELTLDLPLGVSVASAFNAMAHAVEALYAAGANPVSSIFAEEGLRAVAAALPRLKNDPRDLAARWDALYGAWLCAVPLMTTGIALHHKAAHVIGGSWNLPHAATHAVLLPHTVAYNAPATPEAMARAARALGAEETPGALFDLLAGTGGPTSLKEIGMPEDGLDRAAEMIAAEPYPNPRPVERTAVRAMLDDAWHGRRPGAG